MEYLLHRTCAIDIPLTLGSPVYRLTDSPRNSLLLNELSLLHSAILTHKVYDVKTFGK